MPPIINTQDIDSLAHVIQLAIAPVFLLTGVAGLLSVLVNRLGRVVDRFRALEREQHCVPEKAMQSISDEMQTLKQRAKMIHWAIALCTCCALLVCVVVATLFLTAVTPFNLVRTVAIAFIVAMFVLICGLCCFMREITLARSSIHVIPR